MAITNLASAAFPLWNYLEKHGHDAASIFKEAKLNFELMSHPGARFRMKNINRLWRKVTAIVKDPCFGLEMAELWHHYIQIVFFLGRFCGCASSSIESAEAPES